MNTATILCLIIFTICTCLVIFGAFQKDWLIITFFIIAFMSGVASVVLVIIVGTEKAEKTPIEYSASEYRIEYKVTEFQGQRDTTYVLIPKEEKK